MNKEKSSESLIFVAKGRWEYDNLFDFVTIRVGIPCALKYFIIIKHNSVELSPVQLLCDKGIIVQ